MNYLALGVAVIALCTAGCSSGNQQETSQDTVTSAEKPAGKISGAVAESLLQKLCRRWYSKKLILHDLHEEYPTNNEELTLTRDMNYTAVDRVEDDSLGGTWQITRENVIVLTDQSGESHSFKLTELSDSVLVTQVVDAEEENISIRYEAQE
jgi:hypothetical protein